MNTRDNLVPKSAQLVMFIFNVFRGVESRSTLRQHVAFEYTPRIVHSALNPDLLFYDYDHVNPRGYEGKYSSLNICFVNN